MNIFYADDDEEDREIFCEIIQQINPSINIALAKDGQEALEILGAQKQPPSVIFLDINMPRMNGIECMAKLKLDSRLKSVPVIIYSTTSNKNEMNRLISLGAEQFISKASSFEKIKESIHKILVKESSTVHH